MERRNKLLYRKIAITELLHNIVMMYVNCQILRSLMRDVSFPREAIPMIDEEVV